MLQLKIEEVENGYLVTVMSNWETGSKSPIYVAHSHMNLAKLVQDIASGEYDD